MVEADAMSGASSRGPHEVTRRDLAGALDAAEAATRRPGVAQPGRFLRTVAGRAIGPTEVTCRLFTGRRMRVVVPEIVGTQLYRHGFIEPSLTRVLLCYLRPGMVFFDVGAQYGYHALIAADLVGPGGGVVAFEPGRDAFRLLAANLAGVPGAHAEHIAVGAADGPITFHDFGRRHSALNTALPTARVPAEERRTLRAQTYPVPCTTLDEYCERRDVLPHFVKLDAEGAELDILHGLRRTLERGGPMLSVETGDYEGMASPATVECIRFLEAHGYRAWEFDGDLRPHRPRARYGYDNLYFIRD